MSLRMRELLYAFHRMACRNAGIVRIRSEMGQHALRPARFDGTPKIIGTAPPEKENASAGRRADFLEKFSRCAIKKNRAYAMRMPR
jgi:hypothetical protein